MQTMWIVIGVLGCCQGPGNVFTSATFQTVELLLFWLLHTLMYRLWPHLSHTHLVLHLFISLSACLCVFFSLLLCFCPSLYPHPPNFPSHSLCLTHLLSARQVSVAKRQAMNCSYESDVCPSWSHTCLCRMHIHWISHDGAVADFYGERLVLLAQIPTAYFCVFDACIEHINKTTLIWTWILSFYFEIDAVACNFLE